MSIWRTFDAAPKILRAVRSERWASARQQRDSGAARQEMHSPEAANVGLIVWARLGGIARVTMRLLDFPASASFFCKRPCRPVKPFAAKGANPFLEDDFLPAVEVHDADTVLFADPRDRHVLDKVLTQDGNLLLTGITDRSGHWRYPFSGRQTRSHFFSPRASERSKTVRSN